jgi:hypothetical protein
MIALAAMATNGCVHREKAETVDVNRVEQARKGVADTAASPSRDVGLFKPEVPTPLTGLDFPYQIGALTNGCPQVLYELGRLDAVLGEESYQPGLKKSLTTRGLDEVSNTAIGTVRDVTNVVPMRSLVRRASGANKAERKLAHAIERGQTRRAFLRGYGAAIGCHNVIPEPPPGEVPVEPTREASPPAAPTAPPAPPAQVAQGPR